MGEEELIGMLQDGSITLADFVRGRSPESADRYGRFCAGEGLPADSEDSALRFIEREAEGFERAMAEGDVLDVPGRGDA